MRYTPDAMVTRVQEARLSATFAIDDACPVKSGPLRDDRNFPIMDVNTYVMIETSRVLNRLNATSAWNTLNELTTGLKPDIIEE